MASLVYCKQCLLSPTCYRRFLGGKLGAQIQEQFGFEYAGELTTIPMKALEQKFGSKTGSIKLMQKNYVPYYYLDPL